VCIEIKKAAAVTMISPEILVECEDILNDLKQITTDHCRIFASSEELFDLRPPTSEYCSRVLGEDGDGEQMTIESCLEMLHNTASVLQIVQATSLEQIFDLHSTIFEECDTVLSSSVSSLDEASCDDVRMIMTGVSLELRPEILIHCQEVRREEIEARSRQIEDRRGETLTAEFCIEIIKASEVTPIDNETIEHCIDIINADVTKLDERDCREIKQSIELFEVSSSVSEHCGQVLVAEMTPTECLEMMKNTAQLLQIVQASVPASEPASDLLRPSPVQRCNEIINDLTNLGQEHCEEIKDIVSIAPELFDIRQETRTFCKIE